MQKSEFHRGRGIHSSGEHHALKSHARGRAIYSLQLTYYSFLSLNWHVFLVGLSILFVCACSTSLGGLALKPHACSGVM